MRLSAFLPGKLVRMREWGCASSLPAFLRKRDAIPLALFLLLAAAAFLAVEFAERTATRIQGEMCVYRPL